MSPQLWIIAGPNGAGKSTLVRTGAIPLRAGCTHVNPDEIAVELGGVGRLASVVLAGREAVRRFDALLAERCDVAVETTLSGETYFRRLPRARDLGYSIHLAYVWVSGSSISIDRIRERVQAGGHDVPSEDAIRRFSKSRANAGRLMRLVDSWRVYDNTESRPVLIASMESGIVDIVSPSHWRRFQKG